MSLDPAESIQVSRQILRQYWGFESFRAGQEEIINSVITGNDTLALMPTGGGKSLCYQVPAMMKPGICLVISPLIALMKDQVESLRKKNITAYSIYSGMTRQEVIHTLKTVINSNCKFLFVSPERLETALFKEYLPGLHISLLAVDESHCISQWGYDFRPPYLRIAAIRGEIPGIPVLALTASATPDVQQDICDKLAPPGVVRNWKVFRQSFERPNLSFSAFKIDSRINKIIEVLQKVPGTAIVYCKSRRRTKEISELLQLQDIAADFYHAGLNQDERNRKQEEWINNKIRVIVCTNAFGMGIDKPDVRSVIHADVPDCLESYYQEAGRAGRDGNRSYAVLLYDDKELRELRELPSLRFPSLEDIRVVYQAAANYLQVPAGAGEGQYYDFDIGDFIKKFGLNSQSTIYSLKALEQEGWLSFNEQVFLPATVRFTTTKDRLYEFEKNYPATEPLVKALLRAYEGIFDYPTNVSETLLAKILRVDAGQIKDTLKVIQQYGIIDYQPQKDNPQLYFLRERVKANELTINRQNYLNRKEKFVARIKEMIRFIGTETQCRSKIIGAYFGDNDMARCGICDNCLRMKAVELSKEEFDNIHGTIVGALRKHSLRAKELLTTLTGIKKEKAWKVIEFLQDENKIEMDENGKISLNET